MDRVVGICSECSSEVVLPEIWLGVIPPRPVCRNCGAVAESDSRKLPIVKMNKVRRSTAGGGSNG